MQDDRVLDAVASFLVDPNKYLGLICAAPIALVPALVRARRNAATRKSHPPDAFGWFSTWEVTSHPSVHNDVMMADRAEQKKVEDAMKQPQGNGIDQQAWPLLTYRDDRVVRSLPNGRLITSRGPGTAFEFALTLVEVMQGIEMRQQVEKPMLLPPQHEILLVPC